MCVGGGGGTNNGGGATYLRIDTSGWGVNFGALLHKV